MDNVFIMPMTRTLLLNAGAIIGILLFEPSGMVIFSACCCRRWC